MSTTPDVDVIGFGESIYMHDLQATAPVRASAVLYRRLSFPITLVVRGLVFVPLTSYNFSYIAFVKRFFGMTFPLFVHHARKTGVINHIY
jgi:hypothetical protein